MTTFFPVKAKCAVCGATHEYNELGSTNAFGSPDLDTRPPEMQRSTMSAWVKSCPTCGYCAADITQAGPEAGAIVRGPEYLRQRADPSYPELANRFLCKALLDQGRGDHAGAAWAQIHAAWACDDAGRAGQANACRRGAVALIQRNLDGGSGLSEQPGAGLAIHLDLLRRSGRFDEARQLLEARRATVNDRVIAQIVDFQQGLITARDPNRHTIAEALEEGS